MIIESRFAVRAPQQQVWEFLVDPAQMVTCVPGCSQVEPIGENAYRATMATKVSLPIAVQVEPARRGRGEGAPGGVPQKSRSGGAQTKSGWRGDLQPLDACREFWRARRGPLPLTLTGRVTRAA